MARKTQEYPRNNQLQSSASPGITEDYIAQVSGEFEGKVTKKLSQEFSGTMSGILGALSKLDEFLLNPTNSDILENHSRTPTWKPKNQAGIVPRMIPVLEWNSLPVLPAI